MSMSALLSNLLHRAKLRDPNTVREARDEFSARLLDAEVIVRMQIKVGKVVSCDAWQDVADAIYVVGKTYEGLRGSEDPDVRVLAGGYRAIAEAILRPGYRATALQLETIGIALDRARAAIDAANDLGPYQAAVATIVRARMEADRRGSNTDAQGRR